MKNTLLFGVFLAVMVCIGTIAGCALTNAMTGESPVAIVMRWREEDAAKDSLNKNHSVAADTSRRDIQPDKHEELQDDKDQWGTEDDINSPLKADGDLEQLRAEFDKSLTSGGTTFYRDVRNDVTGRWRVLVYHSDENIVDHADEYYNAYFESDDEVHIVVNLGLKTTSVITAYSGSLQIDVHEYVDKEEHDAKALGGGMLLKSYTVDLSTGEVKDLSEITSDSGNTINLRSLESAIADEIPQEYKSEKWFNVSCDAYADESVSVITQVDQGNDDLDAALAAAVQCFEISKNVVEDNGAKFATISVVVVNNGAPVGLFSTEDGKNFVSINDGKRTEISLPQDGN